MTKKTLQRLWAIPFLSAAIAGGMAACDHDGPRTSTVTGTIAQEGFAYPVHRIIASADDGHKTVTRVAGDGSFALSLDKKHGYTIELDTDLGIVPLVLDGAHGQYARELHVWGGGARADIGTVRFYDPSVAPFASGGLCVDGFFEGSLEPCMASRAEIACEGRRRHQGGDVSAAASAPTVPIQGAVAVPELSLPAGLSCKRACGDDDRDDDDDSEDEDDAYEADDDGGSCGDFHHDDEGWEDDD